MGTRRGVSTQKNCLTCETRERTEWCVLSEREMKLIDGAKIARDHLPGDVIYHQGDPAHGIYCVENGLIGLRRLDAEGNSVLVRLAYAGDTIGYRSLLAGEAQRLGAEALKPSTVCFIDRATVRELLETNPALGLRFLKRASRDLGDIEDKFVQAATLDIKGRLAHLLLVLKERCATAGANGEVVLELPISRQDLAAMVGVRPETMSRTIRQLEDAGVAFFSGRKVRVPKIDALIDQIDLDG
jgi:CRP-like cAMP-binding protein